MAPTVRLMEATETELVIDYFLGASAEHLELLGVDPTRLPPREAWRKGFARDLALPIAERASLLVTWLEGDEPAGFSTADKIVHGDQAYMHLHVFEPERRGRGFGAECVRATAALYIETLALKRLFCEPNAFNIAPNRCLQKAGFTYVKTHMTVPGPLNFHQPVTRWMLQA